MAIKNKESARAARAPRSPCGVRVAMRSVPQVILVVVVFDGRVIQVIRQARIVVVVAIAVVHIVIAVDLKAMHDAS